MPDHLLDEGLACGVVKEVHHAQQSGEDHDRRQGRVMGRHEHAEHEREHGRATLGEVEDPALVVTVRDEPAVGSEQQHGHVLQRDDEAEVDRGTSQLEHQPALGDILHPGPRD